MPRKPKIDFNRLDIEYQKLVETFEYRSINDAARALNTSKSTIKRLIQKQNLTQQNLEIYKEKKSLEMRLHEREEKIKNLKMELKKDSEKCSICLDLLDGTQTKTIPCWHTFHFECILNWKKQLVERSCENLTCPICREIFEINRLPDLEFGVKKILNRRINKSITNRIEYLIKWEKLVF